MTWCSICHTRHTDPTKCPGELLATGPERHGWRIKVMAGHRTEVYGILVAEAGEYWRARILTYPNMLWSIPGGRGTIKFSGNSAQDAERQAIQFLQEHCRQRGFKLLEEEETTVESQPLAGEAAAAAKPQESTGARHLRSLVIRFGEKQADRAAMTADLSTGGLFLVTDKPMPEGKSLKMLLSLESYTIPLMGKVTWVRSKAEPGRPVGMGVQLLGPPGLYIRYIRSISGEREDEAGG
jgi:Tfp pilus assembly protein PilZ